jgi:glycosyltransferase involved in cell wall biosynthesis
MNLDGTRNNTPRPPRIALVHDWLESYAGSERVFEQLIQLFPEADLFSLVDFVPAEQRAFLQGRKLRTSFIQHLPFSRKIFRTYLPLFPVAMFLFNFKEYDFVISDSHCMAKNLRLKAGQKHLSYCHSPIRYAWDMRDDYLEQVGLSRGLKGLLIRWILAGLRWWDRRGSQSVSAFIANSDFIRQRIRQCYDRSAQVVHPPVSVKDFSPDRERDDFYLTASRMVPYKRVDLIVDAFSKMPNKQLIVIGDGPEMSQVMQAAQGHLNITVLGYQSSKVLKDHLERCKAFVFAAKEDFGILPVEAMAAGAPVIAFAKGGVAESVVPLGRPNPTGVFFESQEIESIIAAIQTFEENKSSFSSLACNERAKAFSREAFREGFLKIFTAMKN